LIREILKQGKRLTEFPGAGTKKRVWLVMSNDPQPGLEKNGAGLRVLKSRLARNDRVFGLLLRRENQV